MLASLRVLAKLARFLQPSSMTVLQVLFGLLHLPAASLIVAHVLSHILYSSYIFIRTLTAADLRGMAAVPTRALIRY